MTLFCSNLLLIIIILLSGNSLVDFWWHISQLFSPFSSFLLFFLLSFFPHTPTCTYVYAHNNKFFFIGMILTGGCFFVYFLTFRRYGVSARMVFQNNNLYFPAANTDMNMTTGRSLGDYEALDGRIYTPDEQNNILFIVQGMNSSLQVLSSIISPKHLPWNIFFCNLVLSLSFPLFLSLSHSFSLSLSFSLILSLSLSFSLSFSLTLSLSLSLSLTFLLSLSLFFALSLLSLCHSPSLSLSLHLSLSLFPSINSSGGWYLMIVCGQAAHIWVCRTTTVSIFTHGIFSNWITNLGVFIALGLGCFVTYTPGKQI